LISIGAGTGGATSGPLARASGDAAKNANAKAIATARTSPWPVPIFPACNGRDEQRINANPKKERLLGNKPKNPYRPVPICAQFARSVNRLRSFARGDCLPLLFCCHRSSTGRRPDFPARRKLAKGQISCCNIRHNRI
jgi:hypothetical protein